MQNPLGKGFSHRFLSGKELEALFRRGRPAADGGYLFTSLFCGKARNKLQFGLGRLLRARGMVFRLRVRPVS
jgi:hypothetical protein